MGLPMMPRPMKPMTGLLIKILLSRFWLFGTPAEQCPKKAAEVLKKSERAIQGGSQETKGSPWQRERLAGRAWKRKQIPPRSIGRWRYKACRAPTRGGQPAESN